VTWSDIGGLDGVKQLLTENVVLPVRKRDDFKKFGLKPARGVLLHGPPGTGKTLLARAVATECGVNFISMKAGELLSKWLGESEANVRGLFERARLVAPCVLFFDEIDALTPARGEDGARSAHDGVVNALLTEMDGIQSSEGVFVMGATNRLNLVDPALLRPGRFDYKVEIPLPDLESRQQILRIHLGPMNPLPVEDQQALVAQTDGLSGAEIAEAVREAKMQALREAGYTADNARLTRSHLRDAIHHIHSSASGKKSQIGFKP
jgi:transitional endoplasmic reticulum ATPase